MPLTVPHTEVQNISMLNFAFKLMPPHNCISMFKVKKTFTANQLPGNQTL